MSVAVELTAGGVAGALGILATQPLDTIRIRLQSSAQELGRGGSYTGVFDCASATLRKEGLRGLYKGFASPTLTVGAMNALLFFSYEHATEALRLRGRARGAEVEDALTIPEVFVAGAASGLASALITSPTELVKCIAQVNVKSEGRVYEEWLIFRDMVKNHGWLGAHGPGRGMLITMCRETPSFGLYFSVYEASTRAFGKSQFVSFMAGGCAGALAWAMIYPLDVIKTRWQTAPPGRYPSFGHCVRSTLQHEGWRTLFKGFGATMARAWPQNGVIFCTYEFVKGLMTR